MGVGGRYNNACTDRWDAPVSPFWVLLHVADVKLEDLLPADIKVFRKVPVQTVKCCLDIYIHIRILQFRFDGKLN